jgi:hypothetical protein
VTLVVIGVVGLAAIGIGVSLGGSSGGGKKNIPAATTPAAAAFSCAGAQSTIFNNSNVDGVVSGAKFPSFTTGGKAYCVTMIQTYHWNNGKGAKPGTIGLTKLSGPAGGAAKLGPYAASSSSGQGGAPNVNWFVGLHATAATVINGTYTCNDSSPVTWSSNPQSKSLGFCIVYGVPAITNGSSGANVSSTTTTQPMKPTLTMGPVQANFNQAVFGTLYTVNPTELAGRPIGYSWQLALKLVDQAGAPSPDQTGSGAGVDPGCNNNNVLAGTAAQFIWYHPDAVNSTPPGAYHCNHFLMGPKGHQGRITVTVSDGLWACTAHYDGTLTGAGPPAICGKVPTTTTKAKFICVGSQVKLFDNSNIQVVQNGGKPPSFTTGGQPYCVTRIQTYHWNSGRGKVPGKLGLAATSVAGSGAGTVGPLAAQSSSGQNNAPHVNWFVDIGTALPLVINGTYTCTDSDPATWSTNGQDSGLGFCIVYGVPAKAAP